MMFNLHIVRQDNKISPSEWKDFDGGRVTFKCRSFGDTIWFKKIPTDVGMFSRASMFLDIDPIKLGDEGFYYCYGKYRYTSKHFLARARLVVFCKYY